MKKRAWCSGILDGVRRRGEAPLAFRKAALHDRLLWVPIADLETTMSAHVLGVHTKYSWELLRVTARVNAGATQGYLTI